MVASQIAPSNIKNEPYYCILPPIPKFKYTLGMDTETHLITEDDPIPPMVCISFSRGIGADKRKLYGGTLADKILGVGLFLDALEDPDTCIVGHNVFYDISVILRFLIEQEPDKKLYWTQKMFSYFQNGKIRDTGIVAKLIAIRTDWLRFDPKVGGPHEFNLEFLVQRYLSINMVGKHGDNVWRYKYAELDGVPIEKWPVEASEYAILDAVYAKDLLEKFYSSFSSPDEIFQTQAAWILHLMGVYGLYPDIEKALLLEQKITPIIEEAQVKLIEQGVYREPEYTIRRDLLKKAILEELGDKTILTPKGEVSLSEKQMKECKNQVIQDFLQYKLDKVKLCELGLAIKEAPTKDMDFIKHEVFFYLGREAGLTDAGIKAALEWKLKAQGEGRDDTELPDGEYVKYVATDRETLEEVPQLQALAEIGEIYKIKTTYIPIFKKGKVLHPFWDPLKATGRVSVSKPNPNNMPRKHGVRECFRARPGRVIISTDYAQAELCSLAQVNYDKFGFSAMRDAINDGKDLHLFFVSKILDRDYDSVFKDYKLHGNPNNSPEQNEISNRIKDLRQMAKACSFGFPGGLGIDKFIAFACAAPYFVVLTKQQATELKKQWLDIFTEVQFLFDWVREQLPKRDWTNKDAPKGSFSITQHRSGRVRGKVGYCDSLNSTFQGLTADGAKQALIMIGHAMYCEPDSPLFDSRILAFIYDEMLIESPEHIAHEAYLELERLMIEGMNMFVPDVKIKVESEMMYNWSKQAKAVFENGRLIPYDRAS